MLTPDHALLASPSTVFPVYIDPTFTAPSAGSSRNTWTTVNNGFPSQSYWKTTSVLLQVGDNAWNSPYFVARSFVNMPLSSKIYGATILSAQLNFTEDWSPSCTATPVQAWLTGVNPELGDRVPLRLLRENDIDAVAPAILSAARAFLAGG